MLKIENIETSGWEAAMRGMRNPLDSWHKSDSRHCNDGSCSTCPIGDTTICEESKIHIDYPLGPNDLDLALRLIKAGPEHRKFLRMIHVQMDITAPLFWWKEFDTYKVGTTANSCSTMHKIMAKEFTINDFSYDTVPGGEADCQGAVETGKMVYDVSYNTIRTLNHLRDKYLETKDRKYWRWLIELLPSSYNQKRTWDGSLETVLSALGQREGHKLKEEWGPFCQILFDNIPYCKEFYGVMRGKENNND